MGAQVMKMLMPLLTPAAGRIEFQLPEGAVLTSGDLIARLDLDDAGAVRAGKSSFRSQNPALATPCIHPCERQVYQRPQVPRL